MRQGLDLNLKVGGGRMTAMVNIVNSKAQMYRESVGTRLVLTQL